MFQGADYPTVDLFPSFAEVGFLLSHRI